MIIKFMFEMNYFNSQNSQTASKTFKNTQRNRRTALMAAVGNGSLDVVKAILERGVTNINETMINTNSHVTHDAAKSGNIEVMQV